jgi:hypothetical protein
MTDLPESDRLAVQRYLDGELPAHEKGAFEQRLLREPDLRSCADAGRDLERWFERARAEPAPSAPPGFGGRVIQRLGSESMVADDAERHAIRAARYVLLAAAVLFGLAMLVVAGVLRPSGPRALQADQGIEKVIQEIDQQIAARDRDAPR